MGRQTSAVFANLRTPVGDNAIFARVTRVPPMPVAPPRPSPAFVLVHGLLISSRYMMPTAERLARNYAVLVPDLPGFGMSDNPQHIMTLAELADTLVQWMDAVGLPQAIFLGNSLGCQVLTDLAVRYPTRVQALVLTGPTLDPHARGLVRQCMRLLADWPRERLSLSIPLLIDIFAGGPLRALQTFRYALQDPLQSKLQAVQAPTLIVRGGRDPIATQRWAEEAAALLPAGRLVVIPEAPHAVTYSAPDALVRVVRAYLQEIALL